MTDQDGLDLFWAREFGRPVATDLHVRQDVRQHALDVDADDETTWGFFGVWM